MARVDLENISKVYPGGVRAVMVIAVTLAWAVVLMNRPIAVPNGTPVGYLSAQVELRLDPNVATAGELSAIVGLGEKHAQDIIDYRTQFQALHPGQPAFTAVADLESAKGIGPKTAELAASYLVFPIRPGGATNVAVSKRKKGS